MSVLKKYIVLIKLISLPMFLCAFQTYAKTAYQPTPIASVSTDVADNWIPFDGSADNQIIIPIELNGEIIHALVDTGNAGGLMVSKAWAHLHSYPLFASGKYEINSLSNKRWGMKIRSVKIGGYHQFGGSVDVIDLTNFNSILTGNGIDAIIGARFILNFKTNIDFDRSRIQFKLTGTPPKVNAYRLPITISRNFDRIFSSISIEGRSIFNIVVDTGDNGSLAILRNRIFSKYKTWKITDIMQVNAAGKFVSDYAELTGVKLGDVSINRVQTTILDAAQVAGEGGSIGMELLSRYNIYLDGPGRLMIISDRISFAPPPLKTNMGIQGNITDSGWTVAHVMKNSPAAAAGLKDGDQICAVDDNKFTASSDIPRGPDGSTMHMVLCDGRKIDLVRRTFY